MDNRNLICPICKDEISYANGRTNVNCLFCGSTFTVEYGEKENMYTVIEDSRKIIWAPPLKWPEWKARIYRLNEEIRILKLEYEEKFTAAGNEQERITLQNELDNGVNLRLTELAKLEKDHKEEL